MKNVLILGGTAWLSSRIATRWISSGARVTCLARGTHPVPEGAALVRADRDDADPYGELHGEWDEVVDVSRHVRHARGAVEALGDRAAHWTYVSSASVYADEATPGQDESAETLPPAEDGDDYDYGAQKVASENVVRTLGDRARIVRPGLIVGPGDPSDRFGYWSAAFDRAGDRPVLVPSTADRWNQVIDVDDLASFLVDRSSDGEVNAVGESQPLDKVLRIIRAATSHTGDIVQADEGALAQLGIAYYMGERSLPLWLPPDMGGHARRSNSAYLSAGGAYSSMVDTVARVMADERARGVDRPRSSGLSRDEEQEALDALLS